MALVRVLLVSVLLLFAQGNYDSAQAQSGSFQAGRWNVTGTYDGESTPSVNFWIQFNADGTCIDRDNYRCRWIVSGQAFTLFYPDESELGYVGTLSGNTVAGRFVGLHTGGTFSMRRAY